MDAPEHPITTMAINGLETGAFGSGNTGSNGSLAFLESPFRAREVNRSPGTSWNMMYSKSISGLDVFANPYFAPRMGLSLYFDGSWVLGPVQDPAIFDTSLGSGFSLVSYAEINGGSPSVFLYAGQFGHDLSARIRNRLIFPAGIYSTAAYYYCSLPNYPRTNFSSFTCRYEIVSADLQQIIDVTPANPFSVSTGEVAFTIDTIALFGRKIAFMPQIIMNNPSRPLFQTDPPDNGAGINFAPHWQGGLAH